MIKSWKHKGLRLFYETGNLKGIQAQHQRRLTIILQRLDAAVKPEDLNLPGMRFHSLRGDYKTYYAVSVQANWRIIFKFENGHAVSIDYVDYH